MVLDTSERWQGCCLKTNFEIHYLITFHHSFNFLYKHFHKSFTVLSDVWQLQPNIDLFIVGFRFLLLGITFSSRETMYQRIAYPTRKIIPGSESFGLLQFVRLHIFFARLTSERIQEIRYFEGTKLLKSVGSQTFRHSTSGNGMQHPGIQHPGIAFDIFAHRLG